MDDPNQKPNIQGSTNSPPKSEHKSMVLQPSESFTNEMKAEAQNQPAEPISHPTLNTGSIYPELADLSVSPTGNPMQNPLPIGLTGSQIQAEKVKLPFGLYVIVAFLFLGFIVSFFDTNNNILLTLLSFVNLILAGGLLMRKESVRKVLVILSAITVVLFLLDAGGLVLLRHSVQQKTANAEVALKNLQDNPLTTAQTQTTITSFQNTISSNEKILNRTYELAYIRIFINIAAYSVLIFYLTRPQVESIFL